MARLLHISDLHLTASGDDEDRVPALAALRGLLWDLRFVTGLDGVVVSGDVTDDGSDAGYRAALSQVGGFAAARGIPHVYAVGNHDERGAFARVLGSGHLGSDGADVGVRAGLDRCCAAVSVVGGLRVVTLDSLVPGKVAGSLGAAQLAWLREVLAVPARAAPAERPLGTLVVVHHPPLDLPDRFGADIALLDRDAFAAAIAGTDVCVVLSGHVHYQLSAFVAGVPAWVTPGVNTRLDLTTPPGVQRAVLGASASLVELGVPGAPAFRVLHARDARAGEQVYLVDALTWRPVDDER